MQQFDPESVDTNSRLIRLDGNGGDASSAQSDGGGLSRLRPSRAFVFLVLLPTLIAAAYFLLLAADRYESEARYVVRAPGSGTINPLQSLVQSGGIVRSADDAFISHAYITSRTAISDLIRDVDLLTLLARPRLDPLWQYPGPFGRHSIERLFKRMQSHIKVSFDRSTGITTLKVIGFTPQDSRAIAAALLRNAELLINRLSERAHSDAVQSAESDVTLARQTATSAQDQLTKFRHLNSVVDPAKVSASYQETIARLALESAQVSAVLKSIEKASPNNPQIETESLRIAALEDQIAKERQRLAGADGSLAPLLAEYETLTLNRQFAEQTFASALSALEAARADGLRQRLFLEQISEPSEPDYPAYPYRIGGILVTLVLAWMIFWILRRFYSDAVGHVER